MTDVFLSLIISSGLLWHGRILGKEEVTTGTSPQLEGLSGNAVVLDRHFGSDGGGLTKRAMIVVKRRQKQLIVVEP
jgi:hypothetical protein